MIPVIGMLPEFGTRGIFSHIATHQSPVSIPGFIWYTNTELTKDR